MIECKLEQIPESQDTELRAWFAKKALQTLVRVANGKVKHYQAQGLAEIVEGKDHELKLEAGMDSLRQAQRYADFVQILQEFSDQQERYEIATLT